MKTITLTVPETDLEMFKEFCKKEDMPLSNLMRKATKEYIKKRGLDDGATTG